MKGSEADFNATNTPAHLLATPLRHRPADCETPLPSHNTPSPSRNTPSASSSRKSQSWEELLAQGGSFSAGQLPLPSFSNEAFSQRMRGMEQLDVQQLLRNIYRLERLLALNRNERKIENGRHEQDIKELARELSLKEAEVIRLKEELESVQERAGQLLDESEANGKQREQLQMAVQNERIVAQQLQISYDALSVRVAQMCEENQTIQALREQLANSIKDRRLLVGQVEGLERQLWESEQTRQELLGRVEELREDVKSREEMVNICREYQEKLAQLEEKIDSIEEEGDFVHRVAYSAHSHQATIRIEEEDCQLRRIVEEELEESLPSLDDHLRYPQDQIRKGEQGKSHQEIVTATTLLDPRELQLLQLLTQNLQRQHSHLKQLYRQQQDALNVKHIHLQDLQKSLAQMRYEFLLELSRVTALMNQQILENRSLREANLQLQAKVDKIRSVQEVVLHQEREWQAQKVLPQQTVENSCFLPSPSIQKGSFQRETCQRSRCRQLQQDNQMLLKYNMEREQLYQMLIASRVQSSELIVERFEHSLKYILQHRDQYGSLLKDYGFNAENAHEGREELQQPVGNLSDLIHNFSTHHRRENDSEIQKFEVFQSQHDEQLLLESTARDARAEPTTALSSIQSAISSLTELYSERERMSTACFKKGKCSKEVDRAKSRDQIVRRIQRMKVSLLKEGRDCKSIVGCLKQLQRDIDELCST